VEVAALAIPMPWAGTAWAAGSVVSGSARSAGTAGSVVSWSAWAAGSVVSGSARSAGTAGSVVSRSAWAAGSVSAGFTGTARSGSPGTTRIARCTGCGSTGTPLAMEIPDRLPAVIGARIARRRRAVVGAGVRWRSRSGAGHTGTRTQRGCPKSAGDANSGHQLLQFHGPSPVYFGYSAEVCPHVSER
jgi:hypothetical protein